MSEQIREQVSAFLDGELPSAEAELLLKRLMRDAELRAGFGRYAVIGEACRGTRTTHLAHSFAARINRAIDGEPPVAVTGRGLDVAAPRWWRHAAGGTIAAGVAVIAVFALQQRANTPTLVGATAPAALASAGMPTALPAVASNHEALSYTVPATFGEAEMPGALPPARLTNYVFAHSEYTSLLGQRNMLSGLIGEPDAPLPTAGSAAVQQVPAPPAGPQATQQTPAVQPAVDNRSGP